MIETRRRWILKERMSFRWEVSPNLFGDVGADINDFMAENYVYFLDNVRSLSDLIDGLIELSPLADDALAVAEGMTERDFADFKISLAHDRWQYRAGNIFSSVMPERFFSLLVPNRFIEASQIAEKFQVDLGAALVRIMELDEESTAK